MIDFGIAKDVRNNPDDYAVIGTPSWMAPELIVEQAYDERVDLWSAGAIMYELITGENNVFLFSQRITQRQVGSLAEF